MMNRVEADRTTSTNAKLPVTIPAILPTSLESVMTKTLGEHCGVFVVLVFVNYQDYHCFPHTWSYLQYYFPYTHIAPLYIQFLLSLNEKNNIVIL